MEEKNKKSEAAKAAMYISGIILFAGVITMMFSIATDGYIGGYGGDDSTSQIIFISFWAFVASIIWYNMSGS